MFSSGRQASKHSPRAWQLPYVLLAAILAGGCAAPGEDAGAAVQPTAAGSAGPAEPAPSAGVPGPAATTPAEPAPSASVPGPAATTPAPVNAADGTNYRACADGTCEVAVSRPTTLRLGGGAGAGSKLRIRKVLDNGIDVDLTLTGGGGSSGTLLFNGACGTITRANISGGGSGSLCNADGSPLPPPEPQAGTVALQVPGKTSGGAIVLRVVSG